VGGDPAYTKNVEVILGGDICRTDEKGRIPCGEKPPDLSEDTIVIVINDSHGAAF